MRDRIWGLGFKIWGLGLWTWDFNLRDAAMQAYKPKSLNLVTIP